MRRKWTDEQEVAVLALYESGTPTMEIYRQFGGSPKSLLSMVRRRGGTVRPVRRHPRQWTETELADMAALWEQGWSQSRIAQKFNTATLTVSRNLRFRGIEPVRRPNQAQGDRHGWWKGGTSLSAGGYRLVMVASGDPMASMRNLSGYVLEHRLVVAHDLGRPLTERETVHHINGDRLDNRLENLQLRSSRHGQGAAFRCADCGSTNVMAVPIANFQED